MGNTQSQAYQKISQVLPQINEHGWQDNKWVDMGFKAFCNQGDRDQFIYSVLTVISNNGKKALENHDFKLLFSRKPNDRMVATLVAMKMGVIEAKIEPALDGKDQADAFRSFKKHVELRLNELLETIPDAATAPAAGPSVMSAAAKAAVPDLPPAYEDGRSRTSSGKKG
ncbi:hypothetical protein AC578_2338 [Pseudocercospora eumusae]|uniref:Uncharacterized protein n=1 Tax=Pseudocercospora eumusae TaxID=321146 RepID=A0A139HXA7_9PEZI|nr:hypothetical protein AC578_2338 [Pseudocercospora eumusae]